MANAKEFVRKLNVISTNKDKEGEPAPEKEVSTEKYSLNQKWGLCEALLHIGDWTNVQKLFQKLPDQCVIVNEPIAKALCKLIHIVIDPVYRLNCSLTNNIRSRTNPNSLNKLAPPQVIAMSKLKDHAFPMLIELGASLHYDPVLMTKLLRLLRTILSEMNVDQMTTPAIGSENEGMYCEILSVLDACVLPALSYMDCNCCIAEEIWSILKFYPYQYRYGLYGRWKNETYMLQPKLIRRRGEAQKQIKALMKRVSKDNVKPVGRLIGKLSHCSPGFLFDYVSSNYYM
jgi:THO complex subunit 2